MFDLFFKNDIMEFISGNVAAPVSGFFLLTEFLFNNQIVLFFFQNYPVLVFPGFLSSNFSSFDRMFVIIILFSNFLIWYIFFPLQFKVFVYEVGLNDF